MYRAQLAGRRILVVLDNAADEAQVRPFLPGSPGCAVLVTSTSRLAALAGATAVPLDLMPPGQAAELLTAIIGEARAAAEPEAVGAIARCAGTCRSRCVSPEPGSCPGRLGRSPGSRRGWPTRAGPWTCLERGIWKSVPPFASGITAGTRLSGLPSACWACSPMTSHHGTWPP